MYRPSWLKVAVLVAILLSISAGCFVAGKGFGALTVIQWFFVGLFGLIGIAVFCTGIRGYPRLTLNEGGVEFTTLLNTTRYDWSDLHTVSAVRMLGWPVIAIKFSPSYNHWRVTRGVSRQTIGYEGIIPGVFSIGTDEICAAMRSFQLRHQETNV